MRVALATAPALVLDARVLPLEFQIKLILLFGRVQTGVILQHDATQVALSVPSPGSPRSPFTGHREHLHGNREHSGGGGERHAGREHHLLAVTMQGAVIGAPSGRQGERNIDLLMCFPT